MIRGEDLDLLGQDAAAEMRRRPEIIYGKVRARAHAPWLGEGESVRVVRAWVAALQGAAA